MEILGNICVSEQIFYRKQSLGTLQTTAQWCKNSTSGWRSSLKNVIAYY